MKKFIAMAAILLLYSIGGSAYATPLYENGSIANIVDGVDIVTDTVSNTFSLASKATATGVSFYSWILPTTGTDAGITAIDWKIRLATADPNVFGDIVGQGDGVLVTATQQGIGANEAGYFVYSNDFSLGFLNLLANTTYWLQLTNAVSTSPNAPLWAMNNGPSSASNQNGSFAGDGGTGSEYFKILPDSPSAPVPEPSTLLLLGAGLGGLAFLRRKARKL
jgi:hypothetical protein